MLAEGSAQEELEGTVMSEIEPFVDAERAAAFIGLQRRRLMQMARAGEIPAHPIGTGQRRTWRFRLTELSQAITSRCANASSRLISRSAVPGNRIGGDK
jgi:hypothetical protein